jgi:hypothetical protein
MARIYRYTSDGCEATIGIPAQVAGQELEKLRREGGRIIAAEVVAAATPEDAPLHPAFEWDDSAAAQAHREHQARNLVRRVQVLTEHRDPEVLRVEPIRPIHAAARDEPVSEFDPLAEDHKLAVGSLLQAKRQVEALRQKALRHFDRARTISANVALAELQEAEASLADAGEALTASRQASVWDHPMASEIV